jgi:hypothetical protein
VVTITGQLRADRLDWGELMLGDVALDDALSVAGSMSLTGVADQAGHMRTEGESVACG